MLFYTKDTPSGVSITERLTPDKA